MRDLNPRPTLWVLAGALLFGGSAVRAGDIPPPAPVDGKIHWVYRYDEGKRLSRETGRPLFVVFRCERWLACSDFDGQVVRQDPEIARLAEQFVCVRIQSMNGVNINLFQFDYDLTWMAFFMDADDRFYARYGGREDEHAESHLSKESLARTMRAVLELHRERKIQSGRHEPTGLPPRTPEEIPPMRAMIARREVSCIHCHDVKVATLRGLQGHGQFDRSMIFAYPTPRSIGIEVDREAQDVLRKVLPDSPAARAGLRPGDEIESADGARVLTVGDFARVLEKTPKEAVLPLVVRRGGERVEADLRLSGDWKRSADPSWRESTHVAGPNAGFWGMALDDRKKREAGIPVDRMALEVTFLFPNHPTPRKAGLEIGDRIVEVDGRREPMTIRQLHALCQMERQYGDRLPVVILRDGRETRLTLELPTEPSRDDWAAPGVAERLVKQVAPCRRTVRYLPTVSFEAGGERVRAEVPRGSSDPGAVRKGQAPTVDYDPRDPRGTVLPPRDWPGGVMVTLLAGISTAIGVALLRP